MDSVNKRMGEYLVWYAARRESKRSFPDADWGAGAVHIQGGSCGG